MEYKLTESQTKHLVSIAESRALYLFRTNGFTDQAKNRIALRNRGVDFALSERNLILEIGAMNGLCQIKKDVVNDKSRCIHHGVAKGTVIKKYGFPNSWLTDEFKAFLKREIKKNMNLVFTK